MKKAGNFNKFIQKKKNSVVKEEFRKEKKEWKKERSDAIDKKFQKKRVSRFEAPSSIERSSKKNSRDENFKGEMPLNKFISHSGLCGRREAAEWVKAGKVQVNGKLITEPGFKVNAQEEIKVNGKKITIQKNLVYILLNKPKDFITTTDDPQGRHTVLELIRNATNERVYPIGRLDRNT